MAAENDVDVIVQDAFFPTAQRGVLVEVGAARPDYLSISQRFRMAGWKVIAIEPNPEFCAMHRAAGHEVLEYACSDHDADNVPFYVVESQAADYLGEKVSFESFSSLGIKDEFAQLQKTVPTNTTEINVQVRTLNTILATHSPEIERIDILAVDVEAWELPVMRGLDFSKYRPRVTGFALQ